MNPTPRQRYGHALRIGMEAPAHRGPSLPKEGLLKASPSFEPSRPESGIQDLKGDCTLLHRPLWLIRPNNLGNTGGGMWKDTGIDDNPASQSARAMLDAFKSTGAEHFDVTWTTRQGDKAGFRRHLPAETLRYLLPVMLSNATKNERNLIVRPISPRAVFIQLDDLSREGLERLKPAAFLGLETSPGNYQAWVAIPAGQADKDFARRLRKGAGADDTASGATRIAGSLNFKDKYAPDFPTVQIAHSAPGLMASTGQLESMGLVSEPEKPAPPIFRLSSTERIRSNKWPSYLRCVNDAPLNHDKTGPDISRADFTWCMTAISWGHGIEATAAQLMEESTKARENGERYAQMTAGNAAAAVQRRERSRA